MIDMQMDVSFDVTQAGEILPDTSSSLILVALLFRSSAAFLSASTRPLIASIRLFVISTRDVVSWMSLSRLSRFSELSVRFFLIVRNNQ